ncbi:MAG: hypothetical protein CVU03_13625 [Bacteroidetes bacterium HGW-Bacteroidetes-2]|jgi:hypothetical protein|nr:MAG: hypothetical protein CVU03_13625 [Bacteroidetes bacterium HGW-Bacteroidetes-2]
MSEIIIANSITENQISVIFNLNNGEVPFPPININIVGDVDLNALINEMVKLIEFKRKFLVEFIDVNNLAKTNDKIKLIKETLNEIYSKFNENIEFVPQDRS